MSQQKPGEGTCHHLPLAESPVGSVTICPDCGVVQLNTDCVSVRMDPEVFEAVTQMMLTARCRYYEMRRLANRRLVPPSEVPHASVH